MKKCKPLGYVIKTNTHEYADCKIRVLLQVVIPGKWDEQVCTIPVWVVGNDVTAIANKIKEHIEQKLGKGEK